METGRNERVASMSALRPIRSFQPDLAITQIQTFGQVWRQLL